MRAFLTLLAALAVAAAPALGSITFPTPEEALQCAAAASKISCEAQGEFVGGSFATCCYNGAIKPGFQESGLVLATQYYSVGIGPANSTTIHGLWPDFCSGDYPQYCSADSGIPEYTGAGIDALISKYDPALREYMAEYYENDPSFWQHEQNKHQTCFSTERNQCQLIIPPGLNASDVSVLGYFREIVKQFKRNPTVQWLAEAGITPTNDKLYPLTSLQNALAKRHGGVPYIGCINGTTVDEFWYYNHVEGPLHNGFYIPVDSTTNSSCNANVLFPPKY